MAIGFEHAQSDHLGAGRGLSLVVSSIWGIQALPAARDRACARVRSPRARACHRRVYAYGRVHAPSRARRAQVIQIPRARLITHTTGGFSLQRTYAVRPWSQRRLDEGATSDRLLRRLVAVRDRGV